MRTIAVVNQKGGCGKTTVSINLASALAELGQRTWQITERLELAPASIDLTAFEQQMAGVAERECCLKNVLSEVVGGYDYVVVDCPPAVSLLTFNALRAATDAIVPVETGYFSLHGLSKQLETLSILCKRYNQQVDVKVLASMYDIRTKMAREILAELRSHFADKMFRTIVNFNTKLKEAASFGQPINEFDPVSRGQKDFRALAEEVVDVAAKQQRHDVVSSLSTQLEAISTSADELLKSTNLPIVAKPEIKAVETPKTEKPQPASIDAKLAEFYGVSQMNDAVAFVTLYPRAESVQIAGDFNNWQPSKTPLQKIGQSGVWQTKLKLPKGKYRYRLVVDGHWQQDPYNERTELNPFGGFNSVIEVT